MRCQVLITGALSVTKEPACRALFLTLTLLLQTACAASVSDNDTAATVSGNETVFNANVAALTTASIPSGPFIMGSDAQEREYAYQIDEIAYGHSRTRTGGWYDSERQRSTVSTDSYEITITTVTNAEYQLFTEATSRKVPDVDAATWAGYGLIHPYERTRRHAWQNNKPPAGRENHPVVLVSYEDATAYAEWLSESRNENWRLPTETEWEKAVRGTQGTYFPWGNTFDQTALNSHDNGPFDTVEVGSASSPGPFGLLDGAGQVFEWVLTPEAQRAWVLSLIHI